MSVRKDRQNLILSLIAKEAVSTQDDLICYLKDYGYDVTQATISRDIKDLKLIKRIGKDGKSVYSVNTADNELHESKYSSILMDAVISVDYALNTCVIKTHAGMANAACASLDALHFDGLVGTIAGDDTIFALCRDEAKTKLFADRLAGMIQD